MTQREQFELWAKTKGVSCMTRDGIYVESMARLWWDCWKAAQQPQAEPFGYVSEHTHGAWYFSKTYAGVYRDTAKSITAVYTKQPQAEAVHNKPVRVCHIKDVACSEAAVKCGECPDVANQQAEAVPPDVVRDAERLNWLLMQVSGKEFRRIGVEYSGNCQRADIDAAIAQQKGGV